jgi:hypothetical protein
MKKIIIKKVAILTCLLAFCFSASVSANPTIDVRMTNRNFKGNAVSGTLTFDVEIKAGSGYRSNGASNGEWTAMNLRIDIYGEFGITYNVPEEPVEATHDFPPTHQIVTLTYANYNSGLGIVPGVVKTVSIQAGRKDLDSNFDLGDSFIRIATISIPVTGGIPTDETRLILRNTDDYPAIRSAIWSNSSDVRQRRSFNLTSGTTGNQSPASDTEDKIWAFKDELYVQTNNVGGIVRIYSMDGALCKQQTITSAGVTTIKLSRGIYAVSINESAQSIVRINQ